MVSKISVLGSTGSVGRQTLDVARYLKIGVSALAAGANSKLAEAQAREFSPEIFAMNDEKAASDLRTRLADTSVKVVSGSESIEELAYETKCGLLFNSIMGIAGLRPTLAAIRSRKDIALANKEPIVTAGDIIMREAKANGVRIIPVDSEHSAIYQCLEGERHNAVRTVLLTCSGGPFFGYDRDSLKDITPERALAHPTWRMGSKISVDSATLMNKGFEVLEAVHFFGVPADRIKVLVHRESIVHSMVEFADSAVKAQLSVPDMRMCVQYAMTYPERYASQTQRLDLFSVGKLTFYEPDAKTFSLLALAYEAAAHKGIAPAVLNGANERAVELFLNGRIGFTDIFDTVGEVVKMCKNISEPSVTDIENADRQAREAVDTVLMGDVLS